MKEKKTISINLKGIERANNDITVPDGACDEVINMRLKDGAWRPLGGKVTVNNFTPIVGYENFTNIYSHSILPDNFFIAKNGNDIILIQAEDNISPTSYHSDRSAVPTEFEIQLNIEGTYTIESDSAWLVPSKEGGSGFSSVTIDVDASITTNREGVITVTGPNGIYTCDVTQEGSVLAITCDPETLGWGATEYPVTKSSQITLYPDAPLSYVATGDAGKFHIVLNQATNQIDINTKFENVDIFDYVMTVEIKATGYASFFLVCTQVGPI